jgi:hypothetical protein
VRGRVRVMRYFTPEEANAALPRVAALVERLRAAAGELEQRTEALRERAKGNGRGPPPEPAAEDLQQVADELAADGIVLRDVATGLIDFPARAADGRPYWLCWRAGEERVAWWHWPEDGVAGRRPVSEAP